MQQHKLGATVNGLYAGVFAYADDIRTITSKKESMNMQIQLIQSFTEHNGLNLNPCKCEVIVLSSIKHPETPVYAPLMGSSWYL